MTKLTKNEKILRKGNEKWKNFLAEGAFKKQVSESFDFKTSHFAKSMKPEELELLNIPEEEYKTKSKEEVEAIAAALDKAHEKSQYSVVLKSTATYAENEPILRLIDKKRKATRAITGEKGYYHSSGSEEDEEYRMTYSNDMPSRSGEIGEGMGGETGADWDDLLSQIMNHSPDANAAEMAERAADLVDAGNIDAATDLIADIMNSTSDADTSETAEKAYDAVEALQMNEARMGEYGKMDAEQGLPPTKIGHGNEEYMAAYNAVLVARGEEPLPIVKPDQAYLDALRSGQLQEAVDKRARQLLSEGLTPEQVKEKILEEGLGDFIRKGIDTVKKKTGLGKSMATRDSMESLRSLGFEFKEMLEEYLPTPEEIKVMSDVFADYGRSAGGGSSRDPLRQAFSKLPKLKQKVLMNPSVLRKQVKTFEKKAYEIYDNIQRSGDKTAKKASKAGRALIEEIEGMIPFAKSLRQAFEEARKTGNAEGAKELADQKAREHRALMKQIDANTRASAAAGRERDRQAKRDARRRDDKEQDIVRGKSTQRFGMATNLEEDEKKKFKVGEFVHIVAGSLKGATGKVIEPITTTKGEQGYVIELYSSAKMKVFGGPGDEVIATADEMESGGTTDGMELYDIDEKKNLKEEVIEDFEIELEDGITFADVEEAGLLTPGVDSVIDNGDGYAQVYSEPEAMAKMAKTLEAMTGVMVTPKSHGAVDERSEDDERDLEKPVKYGSGAELEFDKKAQKFYDRKRDMYIDDPEEEDNLIKEKDEKEFAKIFATAKDMLVLSARSRVPVNLKSVQSALDVIRIPSDMEKGKLIVKNEYVIADKDELPETAKQISFTKYAMDYLSNLEGEQLDLPME